MSNQEAEIIRTIIVNLDSIIELVVLDNCYIQNIGTDSVHIPFPYLGTSISECDTCDYVFFVVDTLLGGKISKINRDTIVEDIAEWPAFDLPSIVIPLDSVTTIGNIAFVKVQRKEIYYPRPEFCDYGKYYLGSIYFTRIRFDQSGMYARLAALIGSSEIHRMVFHKSNGQWELVENIITGVF